MQGLQEPGRAVAVAAAMGVSESTVSRIKNERLSEVLLFLAHMGWKVVPADSKCMNGAAYDFLTQSHERVIRCAPNLIWDTDAE